MKLRAEQLGEHLAAQLAPAYLISGDEPLLVNETLDALRAAARSRGLDERDQHVADGHFDWSRVAGALRSPSLFSAGRLIEVRLPTAAPGDEGSRSIRELAARGADGNTVVLLTPALNRKTAESAWASALARAGVWIDLPVPRTDDLPRWLAGRLRAAGLRADDEGLQLLAVRAEGNLLAAQQEIGKLALLHPRGTTLSPEQIREAVADGARFDIYDLGDAALAGDAPRALRVLAALRDEGVAAPLVLWELARQTLLLVDAGVRARGDMPLAKAVLAAGVWQSRVELYVRTLRAHKSGGLRRLLSMAARADRVVKGAVPGDPWNALLELTLALAAKPVRAAYLS